MTDSFHSANAETKSVQAHTPGPWPLFTMPTSVGSCHRIGQFPSRTNGEFTAAVVYADGIRLGIDESSPRAQELLANARLIAAAPELLEAAQAALLCLTGEHDTSGAHDDAMGRLRLAIAKATGAA